MQHLFLAGVLVGVLSPGLIGQTLTTRHYDEVVALRPDAARIVVLPTAATSDVGAELDALGVARSSRRVLGIASAVLVDVPVGRDAWSHAATLREASDALFTAPLFVDDFGGPLFPTPSILMRFVAGTTPAQQQHVIDGLIAGADARVVEGPTWAGLSNAWKLALDTRDGDGVIALANALSDRDDVRFAAPNWVFSGRAAATTDDPLLPDAWALENTGQIIEGVAGVPDEDMDVVEAWDTTFGDPSVIVVVLDTGVEQDHPDINQLPGADFVYESSGGDAFNICDNHGTPVAGLISGIANNGIGAVGVAPNCLSASARTFITDTTFCNGSWTTFFEATPNALAWAESIGARVTNNSNSYGFTDAATEDKYAQTRDDGMVHFAAAGNASSSTISYPSSLPTVVSVAATTNTGVLASFSNFGVGLGMSAPGVDVIAADRTGSDGYDISDYTYFGGTSGATPLAAGVAALLLSEAPHLTAPQVEDLLFATCVDKGTPGYDLTFGHGVVNAEAVLLQQAAPKVISYIKASNTDDGDSFGTSVALSEDYLVVGSLLEDSAASIIDGDESSNALLNPGAAFIFKPSNNRWVKEAYLKPINPDISDRFGVAVATSSSSVAVTARLEDSAGVGMNTNWFDNSVPDSGALYVFDRVGFSWVQGAYIKASNRDPFDEFGESVSMDDSRIVVGASLEDSGVAANPSDNSAANAGAAYVFVRDTGTWSEEGYLKAASPAAGDEFGFAVAIDGETVVVGAPLSDLGGVDAGVAYVYAYDHTGGVWNLQDTLLPSQHDAGDQFGWSVDVKGDRVVVGAIGEDGSATGIDGVVDESATDAGAAYVFVRSGTTWSQEAYVKATNTDAGDTFGFAVAIDSSSLAVGAPKEASASTGVGGDASDNSLVDAGAVYTYRHDMLGWFTVDYVKPDVTGAGDRFGERVAFSLEFDGTRHIAAGAQYEDSAAVGYDGDALDDSSPNAGAAYLVDLPGVIDPWTDVGFALAGGSGIAPTLGGSGLLEGDDPVGLFIAEGLPFASANLVIGLSALNAQFKGGVLVPNPDFLILGLPLDGNGALPLIASWPTGIPGGFAFYFQCWNPDQGAPKGLSASNALEAITP